MHKYMRAIGFSDIRRRAEMDKLIKNVASNSDERTYTSDIDDTILATFSKEFLPEMGITLYGEMDDDNQFHYEYAFPYLRGRAISTQEEAAIERHISRESYAGVFDDPKVGITVIFYLQNIIQYIRAKNMNMLPIKGTSINLSALSVEGTILMPLLKNEASKRRADKVMKNRFKLVESARNGDEDAMESLTLDDMDIYNTLYAKVQTHDIYSLVDTYFMPYGVECDLYSILGEIEEVERLTNPVSKEVIYKLQLNCNDIPISLCINEKDLYGEPEVERRFKGVIWLQGFINGIGI